MKANELMIGDWVQYNGVVCRVYGLELPSPRKNERFNNKAIIHLWHNGFIDALEEDVFPIPLTAEILEKNGLHMGENVISDEKAEPYYTPTKIVLSKDEWMVNPMAGFSIWQLGLSHHETRIDEGGYMHIRINYVHELQHALRLCGLNDMADNFQI